MDPKSPKGKQLSLRENPLSIRKVLQCIFERVEVEDLKAARLVCHAWHPEATDELSSRIQPILLHDKLDWKKFLKVFSKSCNSQKLSKLGNVHPFHSFAFFSTYPDDPSSTPYKTAILDYMHSKYRLPKKTLWDSRFYSTYGMHCFHLTFIQFNLYSDRALRDLRESLSCFCPNLVSLTVQLQRESSSGTSGGSGTSSTSSPSPSPSPLTMPTTENVFFPPDESSQRKTLTKLKKFTLATDNKCHISSHALEEFMILLPSLEEFTYRYTGGKKQWTLVRRVNTVDIICNILDSGYYDNLKVLDLDSENTVLSGDDFRKMVKLKQDLKLKKFACQVFIKSEPDWDSLCSWLCKISPTLEMLDIQVRTHFPQLLSEQGLPNCFPRLVTAKLLLDTNLQTFLKRMPNVRNFVGVYDNELLPLSESQLEYSFSSESSSPSQTFHLASPLSPTKPERAFEEFGKLQIGSGTQQPKQQLEEIYEEGLSCTSVSRLKIIGNDEFGLDIEWKSRVFCNIQSFETDIYFDTDLRLIWAHLQHIRSLVLHLRVNVPEHAFTGPGVPSLPPSSLKGLADTDLHTEENLAKLEDYPHIGLLERLETLEIYTGIRQDAYGSQFSATLIVFGVALLKNLRRLVLPPAIPPKCLEESLRYLSKLPDLKYLSVCDNTFQSVLAFHMLKMDLSDLEIVVRYYQPEIKRMAGNFWRLERFVFPDFLPEHGKKVSEGKRHSIQM